MTAAFSYKDVRTPVGLLRLVASEDGLSAILWENDKPNRVRLSPLEKDRGNRFIAEAEKQLKEYFAGERRTFDVALDFRGTAFQKKVWAELLRIPFGETRTYSDIANKLKNPKAVRAVGAANGKNPISIIAPCHRVIGMSGALTGFAGGLETKAFLLDLEGRGRAG